MDPFPVLNEEPELFFLLEEVLLLEPVLNEFAVDPCPVLNEELELFFLLEEALLTIDFSPVLDEEPELLEKVLLLDLALGSTLELRPDLTEEVVFRLSFEEIIVVLNIN